MAKSEKTVDRPIKDIIASVYSLMSNSKMPLQLQRDLEKLCIAARQSPLYEQEDKN